MTTTHADDDAIVRRLAELDEDPAFQAALERRIKAEAQEPEFRDHARDSYIHTYAEEPSEDELTEWAQSISGLGAMLCFSNPSTYSIEDLERFVAFVMTAP